MRSERLTIVRRGKAVAQLEPVSRGRGVDLKALLRQGGPDADWSTDLSAVRDLLTVDEREWLPGTGGRQDGDAAPPSPASRARTMASARDEAWILVSTVDT